MRHRLQRTLVAGQGIDLAARFDGFFVNERVSGYVPRLVEPQAESTGGGKQAVQHIVLQAAEGMGPPLTAGWVNCASKEAKLRTLACMQSILAQRSAGRGVRLEPHAYQQFFERCWKFLESQGLYPAAEHEPPALVRKSPAGESSAAVPAWAWVVMGLLAMGLLLAVVLLLAGRIPLGRG